MLLAWRGLVGCRLRNVAAGTMAGLYAVADELHQGAVPGRTSSLRDWLADMAGVALAMAAVWAWERWRARRASTDC